MTEQTAKTAIPRNENDEKVKADRDLLGKFMAGNPGGPGNPYNRQIGMFKRAIQSATTPEEAWCHLSADRSLRSQIISVPRVRESAPHRLRSLRPNKQRQ